MNKKQLKKMLTDIANQLETDGRLLACEQLTSSELSQMSNRMSMFVQHLDYAAFKTNELRLN